MHKVHTPKKARVLKWKPRFIAALVRSGSVQHAAKVAKVARRTVYKARETDTSFASLWEDAKNESLEEVEYEIRRRAMRGSDLLLIFFAKAHWPEKYRDNFKREQRAEITLADLVGEAEARAEARQRERETK